MLDPWLLTQINRHDNYWVTSIPCVRAYWLSHRVGVKGENNQWTGNFLWSFFLTLHSLHKQQTEEKVTISLNELWNLYHIVLYTCKYIHVSRRSLAGSKEDTIPSPKDAAWTVNMPCVVLSGPSKCLKISSAQV